MNRPDLDTLLAQWQRTLRLLDWRIVAQYVPNLSTERGPVYGLCLPVVDSKTARIAIRDPQTPISDADPPVDEVMVHELIHLHFAPLAENTTAGIAAEEQAVWALTEALSQSKDAGQRALLARAMVAALSHKRMQPLKGKVRTMIDPVVLAALKAAATSDDPAAAIQALVSQFESASGGDDAGGAPPMADAPAADDTQPPPKPPLQAAPPMAMQPRQARPLPSSTPAGRVVDVEVRRRVSEVDVRLDRFEIEGLLKDRPDLTEAERTFARGNLRPEGVRAWLATKKPTEATTTTTTSATRLQTAPLAGARDGVEQPADPEQKRQLDAVDRLMNVRRQAPQAVRIDANGRLSISNLAPVVIAPEGGK